MKNLFGRPLVDITRLHRKESVLETGARKRARRGFGGANVKGKAGRGFVGIARWGKKFSMTGGSQDETVMLNEVKKAFA